MTNQTCVHSWLCGEAVDGKVPAVCKRCGAKMEFEALLDLRFFCRNYPATQADMRELEGARG